MVVIVDSRGIYAKKKIFPRLFKKTGWSCRSIGVTPTESPPRGHGVFKMAKFDPRLIHTAAAYTVNGKFVVRKIAYNNGCYIYQTEHGYVYLDTDPELKSDIMPALEPMGEMSLDASDAEIIGFVDIVPKGLTPSDFRFDLDGGYVASRQQISEYHASMANMID
jgi:hypothetical protein